ncbi:S100P-binding protein [Phyllobates terribilis]|uniref:S100P-binding protein n=1 Tax=Phyllobates terribilis TaxID=111132 RepID=UPI003CCA900B
MNVVSDPSMPGVCSERQVLLYSTDWGDPFPGTMEEITISIVNDRATGFKRERDEATELTPCAKRSRHDAFSCSTPSSASGRTSATQHLCFSALHSQSENTEEYEEDDSLLEPSGDEDDEDDFDCSTLTSDQVDIMLQEDDELCCAAEPPENCNKGTTFVDPFRPLDSQGANGGASLYITLDVLEVSDTLTEEPDSEGDISNYAAMPPSPCKSVLDQVEVSEPIQSSVCNVKSPVELPTAKTVMDSDLSTPLLDIKGVSSSQAPNSFSPKHLLQTSISLSRVDAALNRSEVLDFAFDRDIDNVLTISLGSPFSSDEDNGVELAAITTKGKSSEISDSTLPPQDSEFLQVLTANTACNSVSDAAQHYSPLSLNSADLSKDPHYPYTAEPEPSKVPSTTSPVVSVETKLSIASLGTGKTVAFEKPKEVEENKAVHNDHKSATSPKDPATSPKDPTPSTAPTANGIQTKIVAPSCKVQVSTDPKKEKPRIAISPFHRPTDRAFLSDLHLANEKNIYCNNVLMHIARPRESISEDPSIELASLLNQISRENPNWQHPSNLSKRNHPRFEKKPSKLFTLNQWATENGGSYERFKDFPNTFQRSPIPSVLPFSSS